MQHYQHHEGDAVGNTQLPAVGKESQPRTRFQAGPLIARQSLPDDVRPTFVAERVAVENVLGINLHQREGTFGFPSPVRRVEILTGLGSAGIAQPTQHMSDGIR